ncbi:hypothetical protein GLOIN_2v1766738 [Rhizophagus clarus]|uniref:RNase H type-1 domain-containing protein n=1 Tax=Rhizophagus clarus TaxID=94130 RepID=A0A8H3R632_9GLOM|nr:hypothetical protein GLOIN_2v1766738 [Rhizophagus clarus]
MIENRIKYNITNSQEAFVGSMLDFFYLILLHNQFINIQDTVKGQLSLTIYTDGSFKRHSDTSIRMGIQRLKLQYSILWILFIKLIRFKDLIITLQKVKAHDSNNHSNFVDKLAKEACSKECLVINPKLFAHNGIICWNYKPIERSITLMVKDIKET